MNHNEAAKDKVDEDLKRIVESVKPQTTKIIDDTDIDYFVGFADIAKEILANEFIVTFRDPNTDREDMWIYSKEIEGIYTRAEEILKTIIDQKYVEKYTKIMVKIEEKLSSEKNTEKYASLLKMWRNVKNKLQIGTRMQTVSEVLGQIRRATFTYSEMVNPDSYIPFKNGLLNLNTWELETFSPTFIYTWRIEANYIPNITSLDQTPLYSILLHTVFKDEDIELILEYNGYSLYPSFPRHKVLIIAGIERIGKGTCVRVVQGLNPVGTKVISIGKILIPDNRFVYQDIEFANVLIDFEMKRKLGKGVDYGALNNLFGGDTVNFEQKGKTPRNITPHAKGYLIGNLPLFPVDNPAWISRMLIAETKTKNANCKQVPDLDRLILELERDKIASLFITKLRQLIDNHFYFTGEKTDEENSEIYEQLSDPVYSFISDCVDKNTDDKTAVATLYEEFSAWCKTRGIPPIAQKSFSKEMGWSFERTKIQDGDKRVNAFKNCQIITNFRGGKKESDGVRNNLETRYTPCLYSLLYDVRFSRDLLMTNNDEDNEINSYKNIARELDAYKKAIKSNATQTPGLKNSSVRFFSGLELPDKPNIEQTNKKNIAPVVPVSLENIKMLILDYETELRRTLPEFEVLTDKCEYNRQKQELKFVVKDPGDSDKRKIITIKLEKEFGFELRPTPPGHMGELQYFKNVDKGSDRNGIERFK